MALVPSVLLALRVEPLGQVARLGIVGGGGQDAYLFLLVDEVVVDVVGEGVGERLQVVAQEESCLVGRVLCGVVDVVVPVEQGLPVVAQHCKQGFLHLVEHVEADEGESVRRGKGQGARGHLAVQRSFVHQPLAAQFVLQLVVHLGHRLPHLEEALFEFGLVLGIEVLEELAQGRDLCIVEVVYAVHCGQFGHVGEEFVGRHHVLVDVVEVVHQYLAPTVEVVERRGAGHQAGVDGIEGADVADGVAGRVGRELLEQFVDGDEARCPHRSLGNV